MQSPETILDQINPNQGWIIGGLALATEWAKPHLAMVDLGWAELLYSMAALLYAVAALVRSLRDTGRRKAQKNKATDDFTILPVSDDSIDTIDIKESSDVRS